MPTKIEMTRQQLYEAVWSMPMRDIAKQVDLSATGLMKICGKIHVPTPPQGHWNKVAAGKRTLKRPQLPPRPPGVAELVFGHENKAWTVISLRMEEDSEFMPAPPEFDEDLAGFVRSRIEAPCGRPKCGRSSEIRIQRSSECYDMKKPRRRSRIPMIDQDSRAPLNKGDCGP